MIEFAEKREKIRKIDIFSVCEPSYVMRLS